MAYFRCLFVLTALLFLWSCSGDEAKEVNAGTATEVYNKIKGTYEGTVRVGNESRRVTVVVGNDEFSVRQLPLEPILRVVFPSQKELDEALASVGEVTTFTAPIVNISLLPSSSLLNMAATDLVFTVKVGGQSLPVTVLLESYALWNSTWATLSVQMNARELYCDGRRFDLTDNHINYFIDDAKQPSE